MNKFRYTPLFIACLAFGQMTFTACHPGYKATASTAKVNKALCAEEWLLFPDQPHPMFEEISSAISDIPPAMPLPKKYVRYRVSVDTLRALFTQMKGTSKKLGIILPVDRHCEPFELKVSGAMTSALQEKYGEIISVQGKGINNKAADVRLDWNGNAMRGQITYNGAIYFIAGLTDNNETTYLVYNKEDTGESKQSFETKPNTPSTNKVYYDR